MLCITYACEDAPFTKTDIHKLDNLINRAVSRIFNVCDGRVIIMFIRKYLGLPFLGDIVESRKSRFMDRLLSLDYFIPVLKTVSCS